MCVCACERERGQRERENCVVSRRRKYLSYHHLVYHRVSMPAKIAVALEVLTPAVYHFSSQVDGHNVMILSRCVFDVVSFAGHHSVPLSAHGLS